MPKFQIFARVEKHGIFSEREQNIDATNVSEAMHIFSENCSEEHYKISGEIKFSADGYFSDSIEQQQEPEPTKAAKTPKAPKTPKTAKGVKKNG